MSAKQGHDPVYAECDAAVRGCSVCEGVEQEAEAIASLVVGHAEGVEDLQLDVGSR